nr:hypothetical protein [Candidatus Sigynarchaeota archaeon]
MPMIAVINIDISKRDLEDVWDNLQTTLVAADGIEPIAMGIVFETYDIMIFTLCKEPENLTQYIINRIRSLKGITETTVFFTNSLDTIKHENEPEPGIDGIAYLDVECGKDDYVFKQIKEKIGPEEEKTFTKFLGFCLHSANVDLMVGFKGINLFYLDALFSKIRMIDGVTDLEITMFSRFKTLVEYDQLSKRFPWFL